MNILIGKHSPKIRETRSEKIREDAAVLRSETDDAKAELLAHY